MRILIVTMDYPPPMGGIQIVTKNLEEDLTAEGHDVCLVNFDGRNTSNYKKLRPSDFFFTRATHNSYFRLINMLRPRRMGHPGGFRDFVYNNLIYRVSNMARKEFRPDITHIMKPTLYAAIYESKEPFVVSCHAEEIVDTFPVKYSLSHASAVHCVSAYAERLVRKIIVDKSTQINIIYNSVSLSLYSKHSKVRDKIIVICCRLVKRKNVDSVIRALSLLPPSLQQGYGCVIIGEGSERSNLQALTQELKLTNIDFLGEISDKEKANWFCRAKLFVLCPKPFTTAFETNEEGFGISFIEAQAAGMPVIGSNIGGISEAIGDAGLLVEEPTNSQEIAEKIRLVLEDDLLYEELQRKAFERIKQFDRKSTIKAFERLYEDALNIT